MRFFGRKGVSTAGVALAVVGAAAIGCGGGGGGGDSTTGLTSSTATTATATTATATATTSTATATTSTATATTATATATTATTSTATTSTSTTSTGTTSTASTSGDVPGVLPKNVIFYDQYTDTGDHEFRYISPDGTGDTLFVTLPPLFDAFAPNPIKKNTYYFAAHATDGARAGIYTNSSISLTGATSIVGATYATVYGIQVSNDGRFLVYNASTSEELPRMFLVNLQTPTAPPVVIDQADRFHISPDVRKLVYSKVVGGVDKLFLRDFPAGATTTPLASSGTSYDDYPQFSFDSKKVVFTSDRPTGSYDLWTVGVDGMGLTQITNTPDDLELGASWNQAGSQVAYSVASGIAENNGLYRKPLTDTRVLVKAVVGINETRWTGSNGKSDTIGTNVGLNGRRKKRGG